MVKARNGGYILVVDVKRRRHGGMGSSELKLEVTSRDSCNSAIAIATRGQRLSCETTQTGLIVLN